MRDLLKEIKKHLRVHRMFTKISLMQQLEYRANFIIGISAECMWLATKLVYAFIVHQTGSTVGGLSPDEITLFIGTFILLTSIYTGLFMMNFFYIPWRVQGGELDLMIVKPISTQFHLTMREVDFAIPIPNIIGGLITLGISWSRLGLEAGLRNIIVYVCLIISGTVLTYSIFLVPCLITFWTVKVQALTEIAGRMWDFNNMPMHIYGKWMQRVGTFVIPVFVIANFPVMALFDSLPPLYLAWGLIIPFVVFTIVKKIFDHAIKRYSSAGG
ncbi:MAG: ABC-2 family transporter protein [Oscillospiraceae bacterium]|nr:ABC-2 family transporter protein [Oscillospiraceae bacterium]